MRKSYTNPLIWIDMFSEEDIVTTSCTAADNAEAAINQKMTEEYPNAKLSTDIISFTW